MSSLKLSTRIVFIAGIMSAVMLAYAFRTEATGFTFATGTYTFKIDSHALYNGVVQPGSTWALKNLVPTSDKFFNISDVKPGDRGEATISFHVNKDSWICLDFENLKQKENGQSEPEMLVDNSGGATQGELADGTEFFAWYDDGDDVFEVGEKPIFGTSSPQAAVKVLNNMTYALADSIVGPAFPANVTKYIGITWCAGNLTVVTSTATVTCDGTALGNAAQTDSFSVNISFRATPKADQPHFSCRKSGTTCQWPGPININVRNNGTVINNTTSNSDTGGNTAGAGGTVTTGNASSSSSTTNIVNIVNLLLGRNR